MIIFIFPINIRLNFKKAIVKHLLHNVLWKLDAVTVGFGAVGSSVDICPLFTRPLDLPHCSIPGRLRLPSLTAFGKMRQSNPSEKRPSLP